MTASAAFYRSIRFRLSALYAAILAVAFAGAAVYGAVAVKAASRKTADKELRARLSALRKAVASYRQGDEDSLGDLVEDSSASGPAGDWLEVADSQGHWLYRADPMKRLDANPPSPQGLPARGRAWTGRIGRKTVRVLTAPLGNNVALIAFPMDEFDEMFEDLTWTFGFAIPAVLLLACAGGYWLSGRALRPVDEIGRTVERITSSNLAERLVLRGTGDELDRLAEATNGMLTRLDSAFRLVTQLTADASHELRTPVAIIRTTGEVIRATRRSPEEHEAAWDSVILQTERMSSLIDDLLLLARADAGRAGLVFGSVNAADILRSAVDELALLALQSGVDCSAAIPQNCTVRGDEAALRRLFLALLDNAIKYTGAGGRVSVRMTVLRGESVVVEFADTGVGIDAEHIPHLFDRFYRASKDRSRSSGGSGLGLSIAQWIAAQHGGAITVESTPGSGSTFRIKLPLSSNA